MGGPQSIPRPRDGLGGSNPMLPMLRGGNSPVCITHLTFDDINVDGITNPTLLKLRLKVSKTDPFPKVWL